jgi:hypothetical protein
VIEGAEQQHGVKRIGREDGQVGSRGHRDATDRRLEPRVVEAYLGSLEQADSDIDQVNLTGAAR